MNSNHDAQILVESVDCYTKITLTGTLVYHNLDEVKAVFKTLEVNSQGYIIVLDQVLHIDSTGFGAIVNFAKRIQSSIGKIVMVVPDRFIRELFQISQFHLVFPIGETVQEAIQLLNNGFKTDLTIHEY